MAVNVDGTVAVFERRTRSASPIGSHEPRSHDAGRAMSKFHRISATPAIKNAEREETLPMAGACQRIRAGRSRSDFIHGSQRRNANNDNRRRYAEMHFRSLFRVPDGHAATAGRRKAESYRVRHRTHVCSVRRMIRVSVHCALYHRPTDWYHQGCVNARESGILEYPTVCPGPMTHRLREH